VWGTAPNTSGSHSYGNGKVYWGMPVVQVLQEINIAPDFSTNQPDSLNLMYIHKKTADADIYFVVNQTDKPIERECTFRTSYATGEIRNPQYGSVSQLQDSRKDKVRVQAQVRFEPREALIIVFTNKVLDKKQLLPTPEVIAIENWNGQIEFLPAYPDTIATTTVSSLKSFTDFDNEAIRYFSGTARYTIQFAAPPTINKVDSVLLVLGDIDATAAVRLNKKLLGTVWMPGFKLNITGLLQLQNTLEITLATTYRNRIIGDFKQYGRLKNVWTSANVADVLDKEKILKPSGVMGPLQLVVYKGGKTKAKRNN
jgi:hypothetical protein